MSLSEIKNEFIKGVIDKWQYIDKMYALHSLLFDYAEFIKNTNISNIEITNDGLIMTFRDSGVKFLCSKNDKRLAPFDTLNFNTYEQDELHMQRNLIESDFNILDIGGNFGWYSMHIAKYFPNAKIYSFEPIPSTFKFLNDNILLNKIGNIKTYNFGLSDTEGSFAFYYDPSLSVNASLANVSGDKNVMKINCLVKRLDDFADQNKIQIDFIKCDVEGAELLAFKGGLNSIRKYLPIIFSEMLRKWTAKFNYHPNDIIKLLDTLGYGCFISRNGRLNRFELVDEHTAETNYFFLHNEKHRLQISKFLN